MVRSILFRRHRRLTPSELNAIRLLERADAATQSLFFGCTLSPVDVRPFVISRRPATRRPWASRVSRERVLPADILR